MITKKYTFIQFVAALESDNFDEIDETWIPWATEFVSHLNSTARNVHHGDCTKQPVSCYLCVIEGLLKDYREYYFDEEKWRKENL
jgi:hypothetical protein